MQALHDAVKPSNGLNVLPDNGSSASESPRPVLDFFFDGIRMHKPTNRRKTTKQVVAQGAQRRLNELASAAQRVQSNSRSDILNDREAEIIAALKAEAVEIYNGLALETKVRIKWPKIFAKNSDDEWH